MILLLFYIFSFPFIIFLLLLSIFFRIKKRKNKNSIAFFHPYCNDGGGGERVLWKMIDMIIHLDKNKRIIVYTGDNEDPESILNKAYERFGIRIHHEDVQFIYLKYRYLVDPQMYPRFTMILQSIGSIILGFEALFKYVPEIYFDSMGFAFTFPIFKIFGGSYIACYVHYPTISTDMLSTVYFRNETFNNSIAKSYILTYMKIIYFLLFALLYKFVGLFSQLVIVNSSWTKGHIKRIWNPKNLFLIYPPCDIKERSSFPLENRKEIILSIGQFRPEKNHITQIEAMKLFLERNKHMKHVKLIMVGSRRVNKKDDDDVYNRLIQSIKDFNLEDNVLIQESIPHHKLDQLLKESLIGIHTMPYEHFGIGIVELMASGLITIAHNSGGPKEDIIVSQGNEIVGFLANSPQEYSEYIEQILKFSKDERLNIQMNSRNAAQRFSDSHFDHELKKCLMTIPIF